MTRWGLLAACALIAAPALAKAPERPAPKLIVAISVDQLSADLFDQYQPALFGGLGRLSRQGIWFRNGFQSQTSTETCPGHSTILTGMRPARSGIIANDWFDLSVARDKKSIYCSEDETQSAVAPERYVVSDKHLVGPSFGDRLKAWSNASRVVSVGGKDRAAVMLGGHRPDQRWYWRRSGFVTDLKQAPVPDVVAKVNTAVMAQVAAPNAGLVPPQMCADKSATYTIGEGKVVGAGRFERKAGDVSSFEDSPEFDAAVLTMAAGLTQQMGLGRGRATDVLAVGLSATDYVGHTFGTQGQEMCLQLLSLDRDLGDFLTMLDASGIDYLVTLTADHGGLDIPERVAGGQWVDPGLDAEAIGKVIAANLGLAEPVLHGGYSGDIYIARQLSAENRAKVKAAAIAAYKNHAQVHLVLDRAAIEAIPLPTGAPDQWTVEQRVRASFYPSRSGDFFVVLKPKVAPYPKDSGIAATHGSPWDYDRRVPILFWRSGMTPRQTNDAVETVDIVPTLSAAVGLPIDPATIDGRCIVVDGISCPAR